MTSSELARAEQWASEHKAVLLEAGQHWVRCATWLSVSDLGRWALRRGDESDVFAALRNLPPPLGRIMHPDDRVVLRVRGLVLTPDAEPYLQSFMRVLYLAGMLLRSDEPEPRVSSADLRDTLKLSPESALRVGQLVLNEDWMFGSGSGVAEREWEREVNEHTRPVLALKTIDDYLTLEGQRFWSTTPAPWAAINHDRSSHSPPGLTVGPDAAIGPSAARLLISELHPAIADATSHLLAGEHYDSAVRAGAVALGDLLREVSGRHDLDGDQLAGRVLGGDDPLVLLADLSTRTGRGEQEGWRMLAQGCFAALRNPVAHRNIYSDRVEAFEALTIMSAVARKVDLNR